MKKPLVVAALGLAAMAGACSRDPNPASAGYFSGIGNVIDGTYDRRVADQETQARSAEQIARDMETRANAASADARATGADVAALEARNRRQRQELTRLEANLRRAEQNRNARAADLDAARARLADARRRQDQLAADPTPDPAAQAALDAELRALDALIKQSTVAE